jgi:large-conductance mechanosensitive channel
LIQINLKNSHNNPLILPKSIAVSIVLLFINPLIAIAEPSRSNLVQTWESDLRSDPQISSFNKISESTYDIKLRDIPFSGKLQIVDVVIENRNFPISDAEASAFGTIQVEFVDVSKESLQKYLRRLSLLDRDQDYYYAKKEDRWIGSNDFAKLVVDSQNKKEFSISENNKFWRDFWNFYPLIILIIFLFFVLRLNKRSQEIGDRSRKQVDQIIEAHEQSNQLLKEILEIMKQKNDKSA